MSDPQATIETYAEQMAAAAREQGQRAALGVEPHDWRAAAAKAIEMLAATGETFTADAVRRLAGDPPSAAGGLGAALGAAARAGVIEPYGYRRSRRSRRRGGVVTVWRGRER